MDSQLQPQTSSIVKTTKLDATADHTPGLGHTIKFWLLATVLPNALLVITLVAWSLIAHALGIPIVPASDLGGWLATIGGVMGAIFTAGGIVVALVSVISQLMLADRMKQALEDAKKTFEEKYTKELVPDLMQRARQQIEGQVAFFQAAAAGDWKSAQELTKAALEKDPELEGIRSFLGVRLAEEVVKVFFNQLQGSLETSGVFDIYRTANSNTPQVESPKVEAILWLKEALSCQDNPGGKASAALALMFGYNEAYDEMISAIQESLRIAPALKSYFQIPKHLIILTFAWGNKRDRIVEVGNLLGISLPASEEDILASFKAIDLTSRQQQYVDWYGVEYGPKSQYSKLPVTIRIFRRSISDLEMPTFCLIFRSHGSPESLPYQDESQSRDPGEYLPPEKLISQLTERFYFICPVLSTLKS